MFVSRYGLINEEFPSGLLNVVVIDVIDNVIMLLKNFSKM